MADDFTRKTVQFIERNQGEPFFLFFALHDIHVPRVPHPRFPGKTGMGPRGDAIAQLDWCTNTETGNDPGGQLYNLADDPGERKNLASEHPERVKEMSALLEKLREEAQPTVVQGGAQRVQRKELWRIGRITRHHSALV